MQMLAEGTKIRDTYEVETKRGTCGFFTMKYVPGGTLDKFRRSYGTKRVPVETCGDRVWYDSQEIMRERGNDN